MNQITKYLISRRKVSTAKSTNGCSSFAQNTDIQGLYHNDRHRAKRF